MNTVYLIGYGLLVGIGLNALFQTYGLWLSLAILVAAAIWGWLWGHHIGAQVTKRLREFEEAMR